MTHVSTKMSAQVVEHGSLPRLSISRNSTILSIKTLLHSPVGKRRAKCEVGRRANKDVILMHWGEGRMVFTPCMSEKNAGCYGMSTSADYGDCRELQKHTRTISVSM